MKKTFKKWIITVCLLIIIISQLVNYYLQKQINPAFIVSVVALLPGALKGLEYKISKKLERTIVILAAIGIIYVVWSTFF